MGCVSMAQDIRVDWVIVRKTAIRVMVEDSWSKETDKNEEPVSAKFRAMVVTRRHFWWCVTNWIRPREQGWRGRLEGVTTSK